MIRNQLRYRKPGGQIENTTYSLERRVEEQQELFHFKSNEAYPQRLWKPRYAGRVALIGPIVSVAITKPNERDLITSGRLALGETLSKLSQSDYVSDRIIVALHAVETALPRYLNGNLQSDHDADLYRLGDVNREFFRMQGANAVEFFESERQNSDL